MHPRPSSQARHAYHNRQLIAQSKWFNVNKMQNSYARAQYELSLPMSIGDLERNHSISNGNRKGQCWPR